MQTMQLKFSTMLFWLFSMAGTTVSGRFHCDACGKRQTTSWRRVNNAIIQVHCKVRFTLGKQEIPARQNSIDVRVGDKLKVVQFHPVIRKSVDSTTQNNKLRLAPTRCSLDSQYVHIRCPLPVKNTKKPGQRTSGWRQSRCSLDSHYVTNHTLTVREGVTTQSRAKSPGAPQTSTLSLCLIDQFNVMLGTVPRHSIRYHLLSSTFSLSSARRFPNGLTHRTEGTPNSHILFWMKWPWAGGRLEPKLDNARILRGICFIDPEDKEFNETIKNARRELETPVAPARPCKSCKKSK